MRDSRQNTSPPVPFAPDLFAGWEELQPFRETALLTVPGWFAQWLRWVGVRLGREAVQEFGIAPESTRPKNLDCLEAAGRDLHHLELYLEDLAQSPETCDLEEADLPAAELAATVAQSLRLLVVEIETSVKAQVQAVAEGGTDA
jgi:hypothetical protein